MRPVEFICLANSYKHSARCVAGIRTDGGGWIRPTSAESDGALSPKMIRCANGHLPQVLDVVAAIVDRPCPKPHQPENWRCSEGNDCRWRRIRSANTQDKDLLRAHVARTGPLFGFGGDRIPYSEVLESPLTHSLALVAPSRLTWRVIDHFGRLQCRTAFHHYDERCDFAVTDPLWHEKMLAKGKGSHSNEALGLDCADDDLFLTISLSEPYERDGCCYKLVAGIVTIPRISPDAAPAESYAERVKRLRQKHSRAYEKWTPEEDQDLRTRFMSGLRVAELADLHNRQPSAIRARLRKLGLMP